MSELDLSKRLVLVDRSTNSEIRISKRYAWINGGLCRHTDVFHFARRRDGSAVSTRLELSVTCLGLIYFCGLHQCTDIIPTIKYEKLCAGKFVWDF